ncbi:uncharacterized protein PHACADRAFT_254261 [Phanerochaete carnosa HHB-10118-sp]|uniref:Xylanolytic transcriptional activator regulatory domain-containing protein n=1 Tax=Phanerochaete carnosa (strain HHB-10118-sp) TaxID=650164 RepID=K5VZA1_PHACS|nr:uncharacterized protein PHACADRAFT_254261 [Phanerochaete carnosa HHB-10118-sp]EKM56893.1 hypothetical protein PHACADRAFT_254261 [Phanerochaete carnosa HHB-10118-sp]
MAVSSNDSSGPVRSPLPEAIFSPGVVGEESMFSSALLQNSGADMLIDSSTTSMSGPKSWDVLESFSNNVYSSATEADFGILPDMDASISFTSDTTIALTTYGSQAGQLVPSGWPPNLPTPEVTRHLIHAFFAFWIHAGRLFHGPTFLSSLDFPPSDPRFPSPVVLHAICAVGSMYTADIAPTPIHTSRYFPYEAFDGRWRKLAARPDSFAEQHIKYANIEKECNVDVGEYLVESLQAQVLITWWYLNQGRWSDACLASGQNLRYCNATGLIKAGAFKSRMPRKLTNEKKEDVLPPPLSAIDEETRRNTFWIAYALEREQSCGNGFALELDDADIDQVLPLRSDQFELGIRVALEDRQWSHDRDLLLTHPLERTDSFVLWLKATMLLSRVKSFKVRFKGRYQAGDSAYYSPTSSPASGEAEYDPRDAPVFQDLNHAVLSFRQSFPSHLRDPIQDGTVDPHLYSACVGAHLAQILLHEPHMNVKDPTCQSLNQVSKGARAILDLMYSLSATSYDISLLGQLAFNAWNCAGRALVEFLKIAIDTNNLDQVFVLHSEIYFVHSMLAKAGERMPIAYRYKKTVYDSLAFICGEQFVEPLAETSYHRPQYMSPLNSALVDPVPSIVPLFSAVGITYPIESPLRICC